MQIKKKTWPKYFELILKGEKTYELRIADFECQPGDTLVLQEWDPETKEYTGREITKKVGYMSKLDDFEFWPKDELEKHGLYAISLLPDQI